MSSNRGLLSKGLEIIGSRRRRQFLGLAALAIAVAIVEVVSALMIFALIGMLSDPEALPTFPLIGAIDIPNRDTTGVRQLFLVAAAAFFGLRGLLVAFQKYVQSRFGEAVGRDVSVRLFRKYLRMPYVDHLERNSSELIRTGLWSVNEMVIGLLIPAAFIFSEAIVILGLLITLLLTSASGVLLSLGVVAPIIFLSLRILRPRLQRLGDRVQHETEVAHRLFSQSLDGIRDIKILRKEAFFSRQFKVARTRFARAKYLAATMQDLPRVVLETTIFLLIVGALALVQGADDAQLALLGIFGYAVLRLMPGANRMVAAVNRMRFGRAATDLVYRDLVAIPHQSQDDDETHGEISLKDSIRASDVSFSYRGLSRAGLRDVSFEIKKGQFVGIVGPTGSGKTTLMDIIAGLIEPSSGAILVDGRDIRDDVAAWQYRIGFVPQNVFLMDDTLRRNIALGVPDRMIEDALLFEAVSAAQLTEFVESLPEGLETVVGERGVRVSGGQRQRVAIARALYQKPDVLLFDEGTASLDTLTEAALLEALEGLRGDYTMVSIAHRLASVRSCDQILLLIDGRIIDIGTYEELIERNSTFRRMAL